MNIVAEYLEFFPEEGEFTVEVKFESRELDNVKRFMPMRYASPDDIARITQRLAAENSPCMAFDEHISTVNEIRVNLIQKKVYLKVN